MSFPTAARILSTNLEGALRIFVPEKASKIRATLAKNAQLKSELAFLKAELKPLTIPPSIPKDSAQLSTILEAHSQALKSKEFGLEEAEKAIAEEEEKSLERAESAVSSARSLIAELEATEARLKSVLAKKKPQQLTREDVWFIQPETKALFDARIARGDHSPWGHDVEEWEEAHKLSDEH